MGFWVKWIDYSGYNFFTKTLRSPNNHHFPVFQVIICKPIELKPNIQFNSLMYCQQKTICTFDDCCKMYLVTKSDCLNMLHLNCAKTRCFQNRILNAQITFTILKLALGYNWYIFVDSSSLHYSGLKCRVS